MFNNLITAYQVVTITDVISEYFGILTLKDIERKINRSHGFISGGCCRGRSYGYLKLRTQRKFCIPRSRHRFSKHSFGSKNV